MREYTSSCRICLDYGAQTPIFENDESNIYQKLCSCLQEELEDIAGYPRCICYKCNNKLNVVFDFINVYKETCKVLLHAITNVKKVELSENSGNDDTDADFDEGIEELEIKLENNDDLDIKPELNEEGTDKLDNKLDVNPLLCNNKNKTTAVLETLELQKNTKKQMTLSSKKPQGPKTIVHEDTSVALKRLEKKNSWNDEKFCAPKERNNINLEIQAVGTKNQKKPALEGLAKCKKEQKRNKTDIQNKPIFKGYAKRKKQYKADETEIHSQKLCHFCGEIFLNKVSLQRHISREHSSKKLKCEHCTSSFCRPEYLAAHIKRTHGPKNHICDECGKRYGVLKSLKHHVNVTHRKIKRTKKDYACNLCDKKFASGQYVIIHKRSVHTGERPEVCTVCGKDFSHISYLKQHMRLHTGETPFKCPVCGRGYAQACNMKSHIKHRHSLSELDDDLRKRIKPNYLRLMKP